MTTQPVVVQLNLSGLRPETIGAIATSARGQANGVASLGSDKKVPLEQLPDIAKTNFSAEIDQLNQQIIATYIPYSSFNSVGGVPQLSDQGQIPSWTLPERVIERISALEEKVSRLIATS
jgi:hypothetical protein